MAVFEPHNLPFLIAYGVLMLTALGQVLGVSEALEGAGEIAGGDGLAASGVGEGLASLLGLGRVPLLIWLTMLLFVFGTLGIVGQAALSAIVGQPLPAGLAALAAGASAVPLNAALARPLAAIIPRDESSAVSLDDLVRRDAEIEIGTAQRGSPARARVKDRHGHPHFVMVEPQDAQAVLVPGERLLLVRRDGEIFYAVRYQSPLLGPE